jgi:hypothetical protein
VSNDTGDTTGYEVEIPSDFGTKQSNKKCLVATNRRSKRLRDGKDDRLYSLSIGCCSDRRAVFKTLVDAAVERYRSSSEQV